MQRRWKILLAAIGLLVLIAAGFWLGGHVQPASELAAYRQFLRTKGEKLELAEVLPPPVPAESNSVVAVEEAFGLYGSSIDNLPYAMQMVAPGKALIGWAQPDARNSDFTNSWDEFAAEIEADRPAIELLHQVLERPKLDFYLDYKKNAAMLLLPHLAPLKHSAQKLEAATALDLHDGNTGAAATNILTLLALIHNNAGEGLLISHLVRIAMASIAITPTWELLQTTNVTDGQLAAVQNGWRQMDFLSDAENSFVTERAWSSSEFQRLRDLPPAASTSSSGISSGSGGGLIDWESITEGPRNTIGAVMWRYSWSYSEELRTIKSDQIVLEAVRAMRTNQSQFYKPDYDSMASRLASLGVIDAGKTFFRALKIPNLNDEFGGWGGLNTALRKALRIEAARRVVITAIALKRFQLKHGHWPETSGELVPEFLPSVPIDPYDGKSLKYHPNSDGTFLLYSVGEDGVDDGGNPTNTASGSSSLYWQSDHARDWVWPQPATPTEVQNFYEHPPR